MESELDYDNGPEESAATIHFTYNGSFVGSASVEIVRTNAAASKTQNSTNAAAGQVYYINIKNVLFAVVAMAIFLFALISQYRLRSSLNENIQMQIDNNLNRADQSWI